MDRPPVLYPDEVNLAPPDSYPGGCKGGCKLSKLTGNARGSPYGFALQFGTHHGVAARGLSP